MLKGHCHDKVHVRTWLTPIFLTNKNFNTITRAKNSPRVSLEFHISKVSYPLAFDLLFAKNIFHVYVVWRRCLLNANTNTLLSSNLHAHLGCLSSHLFFVFFFLLKQDGYRAKIVFVSSCFENPLSRKV